MTKKQFQEVTDNTKLRVMEQRKSENTNKATKLCMDLFSEFIQEQLLTDIDLLVTSDLKKVVENFYMAVKSQK